MQDAYGGLLSGDQFAADFANYAQTVVTALGERVTYYTTINEPDTICSQGYNQGNFAPGAPLQLSATQHVCVQLLSTMLFACCCTFPSETTLAH